MGGWTSLVRPAGPRRHGTQTGYRQLSPVVQIANLGQHCLVLPVLTGLGALKAPVAGQSMDRRAGELIDVTKSEAFRVQLVSSDPESKVARATAIFAEIRLFAQMHPDRRNQPEFTNKRTDSYRSASERSEADQKRRTYSSRNSNQHR
jgi:hypothetical protein